MTYVERALRKLVIERAGNCCEYCRIALYDRLFDQAVDHIIAEKHLGLTVPDNLCLTCYWCNSYKGSDITDVTQPSEQAASR